MWVIKIQGENDKFSINLISTYIFLNETEMKQKPLSDPILYEVSLTIMHKKGLFVLIGT